MTHPNTVEHGVLQHAAKAAAMQIPPMWPLATSVAVNPYLGQVQESLAQAGARLTRVGGVATTMPRSWYLARIESGQIIDTDLATALSACPHYDKPEQVDKLKQMAGEKQDANSRLETIAELAAQASGIDWPGLLDQRIGAWAGGYYDQGQALWAAPRGRNAWDAYCAHATHDLTPEVMGLKDFAAFVAAAPERPLEAIARAVERLDLSSAALPNYFHQLLFSLGGYAQYARYQLWRAELRNATDSSMTDLLAIRLLWEEALYQQYESAIKPQWAALCAQHAKPVEAGPSEIIDAILQEATERAAQRQLAKSLSLPVASADQQRPALQAVFCIDVRSEVFRRALEAVNPGIQTLGFAGFFGIFAEHKRFASDVEELRLPVLLNPNVTSLSGAADADDKPARYSARAKRAWGRFKLAAVSSFAFVEATGPVYVGKLVRDALGLQTPLTPQDAAPRFEPSLAPQTRIESAETVLRAMSLTHDFAPLVLLAGHGASVVNNPHASALHCGACGGHSGEVNARLLASLLNDGKVRHGLVQRGIDIPDDTVFLAALHDTTTDAVTLFGQDLAAAGQQADLAQLKQWLATAGEHSRSERALRLPRANNHRDVAKRARNWAEVRPEWALAGCQAFIAAPRERTRGRNLAGRAFLHEYHWQSDRDNAFAVLELIMTAPVVVASWISLQYFGSTVAAQAFGAGNKLLHNVVGGIGVVEGNGGLLRAGLPWQSVHDGDEYVHEPLRLSVCIEAPCEAMNDILGRHPQVRALFDNRWLHLFAMDSDGQLAKRYTGDLAWEALS